MSIRKILLRGIMKRFVKGGAAGRRIEEIRAMLEKRSVAQTPPAGVTVTRTVVGDVHAEWLRPAKDSADGAIVYFHGGGHSNFSPRTHRGVAGRLALAAGLPTLVLDYRLAPEHPFPAAIEDGCAAYRGLVERRGIPAERIAFAGDSSGGGLMFAVLLELKRQGARLPAVCVAISPWVDMTFAGRSMHANERREWMVTPGELIWMRQLYLGARDPRDPLASPLFGDLAGLPPALIHVSADEILHDDAVRMTEALRDSGVAAELLVRPEVPHCWHTIGGLPESAADIGGLGAHIARHLKVAA